MPWLLFVLALISFILLCYTHAIFLGFVWAALALGCFVGGMVKLLAAHVDNSRNEGGRILTIEELRMYREQALARKDSNEDAPAPQTAAPASTPADAVDGEFREIENTPMLAAPTSSPNPPSSLPG